MSSQKVFFITGANRGIGFELLNQLSEDPSNAVIGTARDLSKAAALNKLISERSNVYGVTLDVSSQESIDKLDAQVKDIAKDGVDVLISNAGIAETNDHVLNTERDLWFKHYATNVSGPIEVTKVLKPYLDKKDTKKLIYVSSGIGSVSAFTPIPSAAYGQSKAALNFTVLSLANELKSEGFTVLALSPGLVLTDMGTKGKKTILAEHPEFTEMLDNLTITPQQSASAIIDNIVKKTTIEDTGKFYNYDGNEIPY